MNIQKIRTYISQNKGKQFLFKFKGARNQTEEFSGKIIEVYRSIFIIKVDNKSDRVKSFSYNDLLTNSLEMKEIALKK